MLRWCSLLFLCVAGAAVAVQPGQPGVQGNWRVIIFERDQDVVYWLLKLGAKDGKLTGAVDVAEEIPPTTVEDLSFNGDDLRFTLKMPQQTLQFEGKVGRDSPGLIKGTVARGDLIATAHLEATRAEKLSDSYTLNQEALLRTPRDPRNARIALDLVKQGVANGEKLDKLAAWANTGFINAAPYGLRMQHDLAVKLADVFLAKDEYADYGAKLALFAEKHLEANAPALKKIRTFEVIASALARTGKKAELAMVQTRLDELEHTAHREHEVKGLPYQPEPFKGRKGDSKRNVLVELFTGAQCPPCVAADLAFDGLAKGYKNGEVVLLQYHLHIPGPDALTNPDANARQEYYGAAVEGTPTILFDGKPMVPGGGGPAQAQGKYAEYGKVLNMLLENPAQAQLSGSAVRQGDSVRIAVKYAGLAMPGDKVRLRIALVEDWVRYHGSNGLLYHHYVVRALPGGAMGVALKDKAGDHQVAVELGALRKTLGDYLDKFAKDEAPFRDAQRPLGFRQLSAVAFVQDDASKEVLQALKIPVR